MRVEFFDLITFIREIYKFRNILASLFYSTEYDEEVKTR